MSNDFRTIRRYKRIRRSGTIHVKDQPLFEKKAKKATTTFPLANHLHLHHPRYRLFYHPELFICRAYLLLGIEASSSTLLPLDVKLHVELGVLSINTKVGILLGAALNLSVGVDVEKWSGNTAGSPDQRLCSNVRCNSVVSVLDGPEDLLGLGLHFININPLSLGARTYRLLLAAKEVFSTEGTLALTRNACMAPKIRSGNSIRVALRIV